MQDARYEVVNRILASRVFAKALRQRELLEFLAGKTREGRAEEVTETEIGRRLFGRGEDYLPSEDSIVRGAVRQLRLKLKEYFEAEGVGEQWQIEIPKGGHALVFHEVKRKPEARAGRMGSAGWWLLVLAGVNLLVLAGNVWWSISQKKAGARQGGKRTLVEAFLEDAHGPVKVVVSDFSQVMMRDFARDARGFGLNDYAAWNYEKLTPPDSAPEGEKRHAETLRTHRITRLGDLSLALGIVKAGHPWREVQVRHARDVSARDFRDGHSILLGNWYSTPWFSLFEEKLKFQHAREEQGVGFRNLEPRAGEPAFFGVTNPSREHGDGYGRLALMPSPSGKGAVLMMSGVNMVTMESTGEFALSAAGTRDLLAALGAAGLEGLPHFEAVLETQAVDNSPGRARIVAVRNHGPRPH